MKLIITLFIIVLITSAFAISENAGTSGMTFLKMNFSPSACALGGATVGYAVGPDGFLSNPAAMSFERQTSAGTSFGVLYVGLTAGDVVAQRGFSFGKLGLAFRFLTYGSMDKTDSNGDILGSFGATDLAVSLAYSREIAEHISIGFAPYFAYSSIDTFSAMALGADIGALYKFDHGRGRLGFVLKNFGAQISAFVDTTDPLPMTTSLGASYRLKGLPLFAIAQADWAVDAGFSSGFGIEIVQLKPLYLRVGYRIRERITGDLADGETLDGLTAGFGLRYSNIWADYSFEHYGVLGTTHKFGVAFDGF
ncbi:hypothetical protein DRQ36_03005 [bacterium]|nr:MAG: hypothetical protein DRQ36_03005 [bacterium]